jgi:hypothetical protein
LYNNLPQNRKNIVLLAQWDKIITSSAIDSVHRTINLDPNSKSFLSSIITEITQIPKKLYDDTLFRFVTQEGKKGLIRLKSFGQKSDGWYLVFDMKIQK